MEGKSLNNPQRIVKVITLSFLIMVISVIPGVFGGYIAYKTLQKEDSSVFYNQKNIEIQESAITNVVERVSPSVVSIVAEEKIRDFFGFLHSGKSAGTGFLVSDDGLILTNKHVVSSESADYSVITSDGTKYKVVVKARDPKYDIALLKVEGKNFKALTLGDSDKIKIGQTAIAIGNALGRYQNTVTVGVISARGRVIEASDYVSGESENLDNLLQTDAAINPGNSGGPLLNTSGQVIGINTAIDAQAEGIGFAIPINLAKSAIDSYLKKGKISRPYIGVRYYPINEDFAKRNNLPVNKGALIYSRDYNLAVLPNSPAARAGLREGDIITAVNGEQITEDKSLSFLISKYKPNDRIKITYIRDGKVKIVDLVLAESDS